jgi:hypothetical protein
MVDKTQRQGLNFNRMSYLKNKLGSYLTNQYVCITY